MAVYKNFTEELLKNIIGVSYIGKPKSRTMMYLTKKIETRIVALMYADDCLVFLEDNVIIPENLIDKHTFVLCQDPAVIYTIVTRKLSYEIEAKRRKKQYLLTAGGYYVGEDVVIGSEAWIEPGVFIDHGVCIGRNVILKSGAKLRSNTVMGNNCSVGENTVIGEPAFNMAQIESGKTVPIPSFGGVNIGDNVYIGANTSISKGGADDTILEDNVKIDSNVRVGHDVHLHKEVELLACCVVAGYCEIGANSVIAVNATLKNRTRVGENCYVGMGSVVHHTVKNGVTVTGSPAASMEQIGRKRVSDLKIKELVRQYDNTI